MKLAVFDIDGTLTETNDVDSACFEKAICEIFGIEEIDTIWENYQFVTDSGIAQEISMRYRDRPINGAEAKALEARLLELLKSYPASSFQQVSGAADFLKVLISNGFAISLATGANESSARHKLEMARIDISQIPLASSSDAVVREHIMLRAMDRASEIHQTAFSKITYFGDAPWDVEATANLGWNFIGIGSKLEGAFPNYSNSSEILAKL